MAEQFQFDTSGKAYVSISETSLEAVYWSGLVPFTQGYIEALFAEYGEDLITAKRERETGGPEPEDETDFSREAFRAQYPVAFSDLASETLARIVEDCKRADHLRPGVSPGGDRAAGAELWTLRQTGRLDRCPPLTPYLGDDGKVYLS